MSHSPDTTVRAILDAATELTKPAQRYTFTVEWADPEPTWRDRLAEVIRTLEEQPGQWARIATGVYDPEPVTDVLSDHDCEWRVVRSAYDPRPGGLSHPVDIYARSMAGVRADR